MCGIAGIIDFSGRTPDEGLLRRMLGLIRHRGPDAFGIYMDDIAGIASTRLSIIDLPGGDQPIHNEDQSLWIVYNGEVFNYVELRPDLEASGHTFYTNTDTEVLLHLYEEKGPEMLNDLNGQFAIAIWDKAKKQLFLARDRMGIRPLFYTYDGKRLIFASEIKALFADPMTQRTLDPTTLSDIFTCWSPIGDKTAFEGIHQLMPAHYALINRKGMNIQRYWQVKFEEASYSTKSFDDSVEELKDLMLDACRIRLRADVPVGAYLSGGLDSTYVSSLIKQRFNNEVCTFSVSFSDSRFDEAPFQERAVQAIGTNHRRIRCTDEDIGKAFPDVIWHVEAPLLRTAPAPLFKLSQLVRENNFKVVLTGEGSDEIFAGYDIFKEDRIRRFWAKIPDSRIRPRLLSRLYPDIFGSEDNRKRKFLEGFFRKGLEQVNSPVYSHMIRWENTSLIKSFFSRELGENNLSPDEFVKRYVEALPADYMKWDSLSRAQYTEMNIFLSNYLLSSQGDRVAMAHAVEGRFPFLDYRVIEFACKLLPHWRLHGLKDKYILRRAASGMIPRELASRPKQPYRAPISRCFLRNPSPDYIDELLSEKTLRRTGYFDPRKVKGLIEKGIRMDRNLLSERENMALVGIISTQLLHYMFIENFPWRKIQEPDNLKIFNLQSK
jgi:asparagine synthase (glutamine-hydrolysing)